MHIRILVGNRKPNFRTRQVANKVAQQLTGPTDDVTTIDLADYAAVLFDWNSKRVNNLVADIAATDLVVVASPIFKATYTGMLNAFLDR